MSIARLAAIPLLAVAVHAQSNDWAGIQMRAATLISPSIRVASAITCGTPQSCTPLQLNAFQGEDLSFFVMGTFQGFYALAGSLDVPLLGCLPLGIPGIANNLILFPGSVITLNVGTCSSSDSGRCNGGASLPPTTLFTVPNGIPPIQVAFQAIVASPLSAGGTGLAFSHAIVVNFQ